METNSPFFTLKLKSSKSTASSGVPLLNAFLIPTSSSIAFPSFGRAFLLRLAPEYLFDRSADETAVENENDDEEDGDDELRVIAAQQEHGDGENGVVDDRADDDARRILHDADMLCDDAADDDAGERDDDRARAHAGIENGVVLAVQAARKRDQPVRQRQAEHFIIVDVFSELGDHLRIVSRGAEQKARLRFQIRRK